jgi:hypothetical protein
LQLLSPHVNDSSLANAIVGANLALSRNPSPYKSTSNVGNPLLSPSRPSKSRSASPKKLTGALRETLRKDNGQEESSDEGHHLRGRKIVRRGLHRFGEGGEGRKWHEEISEEEFKRYAGLWASNRGFLFTARERALTKDNLDEEVHNFITRELWRRSRLPDKLLREIWDLVDDRKLPRLTKASFVVGMWLIDQRLKGRKMPVKVGTTVWESVHRLEGVGVHIRLN